MFGGYDDGKNSDFVGNDTGGRPGTDIEYGKEKGIGAEIRSDVDRMLSDAPVFYTVSSGHGSIGGVFRNLFAGEHGFLFGVCIIHCNYLFSDGGFIQADSAGADAGTDHRLTGGKRERGSGKNHS